MTKELTVTRYCPGCGAVEGTPHFAGCRIVIDHNPGQLAGSSPAPEAEYYNLAELKSDRVLGRLKALEQRIAKLEQESIVSNLWADKWAQEQIRLAQIITEEIPRMQDLEEMRNLVSELKKLLQD